VVDAYVRRRARRSAGDRRARGEATSAQPGGTDGRQGRAGGSDRGLFPMPVRARPTILEQGRAMTKVSLALMWHQHQPYYPDDVAGENPMPWVRLHGTKDYLGMALHLEEVPEFRCTINLVPSLLVQLQAYVDGATDRHLRISRMPADGLEHDDAIYLLDNFFMANPDGMIRPHPRYLELSQQRGLGSDTAAQALPRFRERDIRDLQVWSNLTWIHPLLFEKDAELREFRAKG